MKILEYDVAVNKPIEEERIAILSDFHISRKTDNKKFSDVYSSLNEIKPTKIVIPGGFYNMDETDLFKTGSKIRTFISNISEIADVYYVKGESELEEILLNEYLREVVNPHFHHLHGETDVFKDGFVEYDSDNSVIKDKNVNVAALTLGADFYLKNKNEKIRELLLKYQSYIESLANKCKSDNLSVLLCYDPIIVKAYEFIESLKAFDLVISGHNHGGLSLDNIKYDSTNSKGMIQKGNTTFILSEGVTKYHSRMGNLECFEKFNKGTIDVVRARTKINK